MKCDERGTGWYGDTNISWQRIWSRMVAKSRTCVDVIPVAKLAWWTRFGVSFEIDLMLFFFLQILPSLHISIVFILTYYFQYKSYHFCCYHYCVLSYHLHTLRPYNFLLIYSILLFFKASIAD